MNKKIILFFLICLFQISLNGCWDYKGLNELEIVTGFAIDKDEMGDNYNLTFEIIDLASSSKTGPIKTKYVESGGKTVFDAIRNAKKRLQNALFFNDAQIVIIGKKVVENEDISSLLDMLIRNTELRETNNIIISQEQTAKEIIMAKSIDDTIVSYEINDIVDRDSHYTASLKNYEQYEVYDIILSKGISLALPAIHLVKNEDETVVECNGTAVFRGERFIGFLTPEESKYFLFASNDVQGGIITLNSSEQANFGPDSLSIEVRNNKTDLKISHEDDKFKVKIKTKTDVSIGESKEEFNILDHDEIKGIEKRVATKIENGIASVIKKVQLEYDSDIFGFGNTLYKSDPKLWKQVADDWNSIFPMIEVEVESTVNIIHSEIIKIS